MKYIKGLHANMTEREFVKSMNYGLIIVEKDEDKRFDGDNCLFYHFCGYLEKPTQVDKNVLRKELKTDEELKLDNIDDLEIVEAPQYVVDYFKNKKMALWRNW